MQNEMVAWRRFVERNGSAKEMRQVPKKLFARKQGRRYCSAAQQVGVLNGIVGEILLI